MPNEITLFKKYVDLLDEVYQSSSCTTDLDGDSALIQKGANANEILIPVMDMDGLGDYSRQDGYLNGSAYLYYQTMQFNYDRGRTFTIDAMDNEETAGLAFGRLASEFIRTKVVPELDAFRFATYAGFTGADSEDNVSVDIPNNNSFMETFTDAEGGDILAALVRESNIMDESEVPAENRILYITPTLYRKATNVDTYKSKAVLDGFSKIVRVPQSRFNTTIDLYGVDGDDTSGGFITSGNDINFMIVHKPSVLQYSKHTVNKIITPELNQTSDGYKFFYRAYGLASVCLNKANGIRYSHA